MAEWLLLPLLWSCMSWVIAVLAVAGTGHPNEVGESISSCTNLLRIYALEPGGRHSLKSVSRHQ